MNDFTKPDVTTVDTSVLIALYRKIGEVGVRQVLTGEAIVCGLPRPACYWSVEQEVTYIDLPPSDGTLATQWIPRLAAVGATNIEPSALQILLSDHFTPTIGVRHRIALLPGRYFTDLPGGSYWGYKDVVAEGARRGWKDMNLEALCMVRELFWEETFKRMGMDSITAVHTPVVFPDLGLFNGKPKRTLRVGHNGGHTGFPHDLTTYDTNTLDYGRDHDAMFGWLV